MLDGYIIERIRKQREAAEVERAPLSISIPEPEEDRPPGAAQPQARSDADEDRGVVEVDFSI